MDARLIFIVTDDCVLCESNAKQFNLNIHWKCYFDTNTLITTYKGS